MMLARVIENELEPGRWLVCRVMPNGWSTVVVDCPSAEAAETERRRLQRLYDAGDSKPLLPGEMRQIPLGFYTDEDAA